MVQITYIFMVMRNKIVLDQQADRTARLKVLPFASFTPVAAVGSPRRVSDIQGVPYYWAHFVFVIFSGSRAHTEELFIAIG